jgi:hypothetical protein
VLLLGNVCFDDLVGDVATATAEGVPCPDMASPKPLAQVRKLRQQAIGTFALHPLDQATNGNVRRDGDHHRDMSRRDRPLQDIDTRFLALVTDDSAYPFRHLTAQALVTVLGDPDDMQGERESRVGAVALVTHTPQFTENLLKLPPKGVSFAPPNWRQ